MLLLNCYYYAPHNHTLLAEYLDADLARMASLGTDAVSMCVQEGQLTNWHQQRLRNVVDRVHAHGMKAHAVPNRWAGLVAGWLDGFGHFTIQNPDTLVRDGNGVAQVRGEMVSCVHHPKVIAHVREALTTLLTRFEFDGLIWDEPHAPGCFCEHCTRLQSSPDADWYRREFARFLDDMSQYAKTLNPRLVVSLFVQPHEGELLNALLNTQHIDFLGSDGHVRTRDHQMHRMKGTIFDAYDEFATRLRDAGKRSFFLLEAQRHRDEDLENYLANVERAFSLPMDHLMYYYSAHEMSTANEARFNQATWAAVLNAHRRRPT